MSNHTEGDWEIVIAPEFGPEDFEGITIESPSTGTIICEIAGGLPLIEIMGNAKLIKAAPKMLQMLKAIINLRMKYFIPENEDDSLLNWTDRVEQLIRDIEKVETL